MLDNIIVRFLPKRCESGPLTRQPIGTRNKFRLPGRIYLIVIADYIVYNYVET